MKKALGVSVVALGILGASAFASSAQASEGVIDLANRTGGDTRCYALSVLMEDNNFRILMTCRDILYPGGTNVFHYVVWANPMDGGNPTRLGTLGLGKIEFRARTSFSGLFVTKETEQSPRSPAGEVIMQGSVRAIASLESPDVTSLDEPELGEPEVSPTPEPQSRGLNIFRVGGTLGFIALFGIILFVLFITRR